MIFFNRCFRYCQRRETITADPTAPSTSAKDSQFPIRVKLFEPRRDMGGNIAERKNGVMEFWRMRVRGRSKEEKAEPIAALGSASYCFFSEAVSAFVSRRSVAFSTLRQTCAPTAITIIITLPASTTIPSGVRPVLRLKYASPRNTMLMKTSKGYANRDMRSPFFILFDYIGECLVSVRKWPRSQPQCKIGATLRQSESG